MPAYHISGVSGVGKTAVGMELHMRGYLVVNTDKVLAHWMPDDSESRPSGLPRNREHPDADNYVWNWDSARFEEVHGSHPPGEHVFYCGGANNESEFSQYFEEEFRLVVDGETLRNRLDRRPDQVSPQSCERIRYATREYKKNDSDSAEDTTNRRGSGRSVIIVDASPQPEVVAGVILSHVERQARPDLSNLRRRSRGVVRRTRRRVKESLRRNR